MNAPFPNFPRWLSRTLVVAGALLIATVPFILVTMGLKSDFLALYAGGLALLQGESAQLYNAEALREWQVALVGPYSGSRFVYLPLYAAFYLPLAAQPLLLARMIWLGLSLVLIGVAVRMSRHWSGLSTFESALALLGFPALYGPLMVGQNSPLTLALFAAIAGLLWRGRGAALVGVMAGLALYKPQLLMSFLALCLWQRRWRTIAAFLVTGSFVGIGSLLISPSATVRFLSQGQGLLSKTVYGEVVANASPYAELRHFLPPDMVLPFGGLLSLLLLGMLLAAWGQTREGNAYQHAMLWLAPLLVTPYVASYDLLLLMLPLTFLARRLKSDWLMQIAIAILWIGPLVNLVTGGSVGLSAWGTLLVYGLCFRRARAESRGRLPSNRLSYTNNTS